MPTTYNRGQEIAKGVSELGLKELETNEVWEINGELVPVRILSPNHPDVTDEMRADFYEGIKQLKEGKGRRFGGLPRPKMLDEIYSRQLSAPSPQKPE